MCDLSVSAITHAGISPTSHRPRLHGPPCTVGGPWSGAGSTRCSLSEGSPGRGRARRTPCARAGSGSGVTGRGRPSPASSCSDDVRAPRRWRAAVRLPRRPEARACARRPRHRRQRALLPGRRRLDGRLHRLPAATGRRAGDRARRRVTASWTGRLRNDPRVEVLERTNARHLDARTSFRTRPILRRSTSPSSR